MEIHWKLSGNLLEIFHLFATLIAMPCHVFAFTQLVCILELGTVVLFDQHDHYANP